MLTQHEWSLFLIAGFRANWTLIRVLSAASGELPWRKGQKKARRTKEELNALYDQVEGLLPRVRSKSGSCVSTGKPIRALLAERARFAAEALWDGDEKKAYRMMTVQTKRSRSIRELEGINRTSKEGAKRNSLIKRTRFVSARALDKTHDWGTVK